MAALIFSTSNGASADNAKASAVFNSPDILILGDSQIPFGAGPRFLDFFENLVDNCGFKSKISDKLGARSVAVIGVRSSSLGTWTKRTKSGKRPICAVDPKWKVNAGAYGTVNQSDNIYVQIGKGDNYQFCAPNKSAFETMFQPEYYDPKLLFLTFLGNSSATWAKDRNAALSDVKAAMAHLPKHIPCVFMTTAPTFRKNTVNQRLKAQGNLKSAFVETGNRCAFVDGFTSETIKSNLGVRRHFRQRKSGKVKDPFHPNKRAAIKFFRLRHAAICDAIATQLK
ncbi:SGNH/GDSL hydrolase family protein [Amylibacter sp.]|nr:SGNH/GDSL hydrolase family protein [Amylibacter sp.]